jgi:Rrf2 family protein
VKVGAKSDYAVRAAVALARAHPAYVKAQVASSDTGVPLEFLENILRELRRAGLVNALRGADGGYCLAVDPCDVTVAMVVRAVKGKLVDGDGATPDADGDLIARLWRDLGAATQRALDSVTIADLAFEVPATPE